MNNVVVLSDYREPRRDDDATTADTRTAEELAAMSHGDVLAWAGTSFDRLRAVAAARDYYPQRISYQLEDAGITTTAPQAAILSDMVAQAGPFLNRRQRWIMRQLKVQPKLPEDKLARLAATAVEYRDFKQIDRAVANDVNKLAERGLVKVTLSRTVTLVTPVTAVEAPRGAPAPVAHRRLQLIFSSHTPTPSIAIILTAVARRFGTHFDANISGCPPVPRLDVAHCVWPSPRSRTDLVRV